MKHYLNKCFIPCLLMFCSTGLAQETKHIDEVVVIASRTVNKPDGYITNLKGMNIVKGKPAASILSFLPNISFEEGKFKINGLSVSEIYVDGVKLSDTSELNKIPGERIDKVEVKYLAGAENNAALSGGSIIITLRRPENGGFYGSIIGNSEWFRSCGFGNEDVGLLFNARYKNLSLYDNMDFGHKKIKETAEQWQAEQDIQSLMSNSLVSSSVNFRNRISLTQEFKSGVQIGGSYLYASSNPSPTTKTFANNEWTSISEVTNIHLHEGTIKFSMPLNKRGSSIEVTTDYLNRHSNNNSLYYIEEENTNNITEQNKLNLWKFKADILYPCNRSFIFKFGTSAQLLSSQYSPSGNNISNRFNTSTETTKTSGVTPIVYTVAQGKISKFRYSAGVNWQLNHIGFSDLTSNIHEHNNQWSFNPIIQIMMPFGKRKEHSLMLNYKRTMSDIPYSAISSAITWKDAYNYSVGNANLKAPSSDMLMVGLSMFRNKVTLTAIYAYSHNRIYWQTFNDEINSNILYTKPINISGQSYWGMGAEYMEAPTKWWNFKFSGRVEITPENLQIGTAFYNKTRFKEYFSFNNNFEFTNGWGGMLNASIEPKYQTLERTYHTVYSVNGRIYKSFLNDNLQFAIDFTPLANRRKLDRQIGTSKITYQNTSSTQYVGLSITWNFSKGKKVKVNSVDGIQEYHQTKDNWE